PNGPLSHGQIQALAEGYRAGQLHRQEQELQWLGALCILALVLAVAEESALRQCRLFAHHAVKSWFAEPAMFKMVHILTKKAARKEVLACGSA
ncbi:unnamed protein product, partial [Symbiodinium pilosum]